MSRYLAHAGAAFEETLGGPEVGTWSMEPGTDRDTEAGERTLWTVTETLRKIYLTPTQE